MTLAILGVTLYCVFLSLHQSGNSQDKGVLGRLGFLRSSPAVTQRNEGNSKLTHFKERQCTIYFAPSSLKGFPGYGIYTTRDLWKGERILGGPDGVSIPVEQPRRRTDFPKKDLVQKWTRLWGDYWWGRGVPDHVMYEDSAGVVDYQIGFGFLPNHHCLIDSLDPQYPPNAPYEDSLAQRFESPGAGAFSYSKGREFISFKDVGAGEELFMNYGWCKHDQRGPPWTKDAFLTEDFDRASTYIWLRIGPNAVATFNYDDAGNVILDPPMSDDRLAKQLVPSTKQEVQELAAQPLTRKDLPIYLSKHKGVNRRTTEWIKDNGMCLETMKPRTSTLPHAGQGGFAQHKVKQGDIIVPAPALHIMDRAVLNLYDKTGKTKVGVRLLLNYCFSHPKSTVLLCPNTNAVLINHCSHRKKQCGPEGPNADIRWSSGWDETSNSWRKMSLSELGQQEHRGLSFEIIATRDINPGDEVFLDYGIEWEKAWEAHVKKWKSPKHPSLPKQWISAKEANEDSEAPILKELMVGMPNLQKGKEFATDPYLFTGCVYWPSKADNDPVYKKPPADDWNTWKATEILEEFSDDGETYHYWRSGGYATHSDGIHWPCSVMWKESHSRYVVRIHQQPWQETMPWDENGTPRLLYNYPRSSIHYFVMPDSSDQHLPGVFRHPLVMKDEVFPEQWKNL